MYLRKVSSFDQRACCIEIIAYHANLFGSGDTTFEVCNDYQQEHGSCFVSYHSLRCLAQCVLCTSRGIGLSPSKMAEKTGNWE